MRREGENEKQKKKNKKETENVVAIAAPENIRKYEQLFVSDFSKH